MHRSRISNWYMRRIDVTAGETVGGLISQVPLVGVAGFIASLVGAVLAISNLGGLMNGVISKAQNIGPKKGPGKWSQGFEQRWDRRNLGE